MKELIQQRLKHISNLDERRMFRKELEDVYTHIVDYLTETFFTCEKFPQAPSKTRLEHERKDRGTLSHCPASPF